MLARISWRDERGQVGGIEALPLGVLIFVVGGLLAANAWAVIDSKLAVTAAAREATRTYVEAASHPVGLAAATAAARDAVAGHGRNADALEVVEQPNGDAPLRRCNRVHFTLEYEVPAITLPFVGGFGRGITVRASDSEIVDPFRSGLEGAASCA